MAKESRTIRVRRYKLWGKMATPFSNLSEMKVMQWYLSLPMARRSLSQKQGLRYLLLRSLKEIITTTYSNSMKQGILS